MVQHTPGPWSITRDGFYVVAGKEAPGHAARSICASCSPETWRRADALLIAAAPDLLAALRAVPELPSDWPSDDAVGAFAEAFRAWEEAARAALARASGEGR